MEHKVYLPPQARSVLLMAGGRICEVSVKPEGPGYILDEEPIGWDD